MKKTYLVPAILAGTILGGTILANGARAQENGDALSADQYLQYLSALATAQTLAVSDKGSTGGSASTVGIPSGFALPRGAAFLAGAASNVRGRTDKDLDGSGAFGFGFGDAGKAVGIELVVGISSVEPVDFGDSGSVALKVARQVASPFAGGIASIGFGVGRVTTWGDVDGLDPNYYLVGSSTLRLGNRPAMISVGYGSKVGTFETDPGAMAGFGIGLTDWLSGGASWYGDEAIAGLTASASIPFTKVGMQLGVSYGDVTHANSDGRWVLSLAFIKTDLY